MKYIEEKAKWDAEHQVPIPAPTIEERLTKAEADIAALKTAKETPQVTRE